MTSSWNCVWINGWIRLVVWIIVSLCNLTDTSGALLPRCLSNYRAIVQNILSYIKTEPWFFPIYVVRDLFPAGPISVIFVIWASISCNCDFSSQIDLWSRLWIPPRICWWIHICKVNNRGVVTTTGREMAKIRSPVDRVRVRARVWLGLVSNSVSSG